MEMKIYFEGNKRINAKWNGTDIKTDQPVAGGGEGTAPSPFDLFLVSIGTCTGIFIKNFCDQRSIPADDIHVIQKMNFNPSAHLIDKINLEIQLPPGFPEKYRAAVIRVAEQCTVKRHLHHPPEIAVKATANNNSLIEGK